jgi:hypothetical protein
MDINLKEDGFDEWLINYDENLAILNSIRLIITPL